jgi:hypothetical protein
MKEDSVTNFGLLIAYVLPGTVSLWGIAQIFPSVGVWFSGYQNAPPTVGTFLYHLFASLGLGLTASTIRWLCLDMLHSRTGIPLPRFDFSKLGERVEAFDLLVESHYRYYQFYGNSLVSLFVAYVAWRWSPMSDSTPLGWPELFLVSVGALFLAASRDTLRKYYGRVAGLLNEVRPSDVTLPRQTVADPGSSTESVNPSPPSSETP